MTWLFPFYLLGAAAIIGPILMHLRRRPPQDRVEFSSLMFLEAQTPMPVSKRRLEHWLLLLLRCLALILLALMFARPLWRNDETAVIGQNQATLILLDRSASMQRGDLWSDATAQATKLISATSASDRLALTTFDREIQPLWTFGEDIKAASTRSVTLKQRLQETKPGWSASELGQALVQAASVFGSEPGMTGLKKRIVVITDLQEGSKLDALRSQVWPETITVNIVQVEVPNADNLSLTLAATSTEETDRPDQPKSLGNAPSAVRVRLGNARESKVSDFTLAWEKGGLEPVVGYLPPGASRVLPAPPAKDTDAARVLRLTGDAWDFDNRVFISPPQPKPVHIVFIGDESTQNEAASPLFYLSRALQTTTTLLPELQVLPPNAPTLPADTDIVFISGATLTDPMIKALQAFMEAGGMAVSVIGDGTSDKALQSLSGIGGISVNPQASSSTADYLMLAEVNTAHPLLRPFADDRLRDFTKLRFWKHRSVILDAQAANQIQVIARFDNGDPAILATAQRKGSLILLTSGWHPADSQLALSTKFVPLLYGWLEAAGFRNEQSASLLVGDVLPVEAGTSVMTPEGQILKPKAGETLRATSIGLYTVQSTPPQLIAVNLPPEESRVTPLEADKLREFGVHLDMGVLDKGTINHAEERERLATNEQEGRQRAWLWLLAGMLVILGWETWLAGRIREGRPQATYS